MNLPHRPLPALALALALPLALLVASVNAPAADLAGLSLEELLKVEVTSVAKKAQALGNVAAAVHVVTQEDIRASGARSLPEALRLAPGVDVAQISGSRWAVSIRGGTGRFANKLQVLVDGRSMYSSLFSGVFWEAERLPLSEVERIEVLRGPAGSTWGANAVNGVINIITKAAAAGDGTRLSLRAGTQDLAAAELATSLPWGPGGALRLYGRADRSGASRGLGGGGAGDEASSQVVGLRADLSDERGSRSQMRLEATHVESGENFFIPSVLPPYGQYAASTQKHSRLVAQAQHERRLDAVSMLALSASAMAEDANINSALRHRHAMLELDAQHRWLGLAGHDITWGGGARFNRSTGSQSDIISFDPARLSWTEWRLYGQDEWLLLPERLRVSLGLRADHHPSTGTQAQPSVRLLWNLSPHSSLWAAASRAVRAPSRGEDDIRIKLAVLPPGTALNPGPLPVQLRINGPADATVAERLNAFELGLRSQLDRTLSLDLSLFDHRFQPDLSRSQGTPQLVPAPAPHLVVDLLGVAVKSRTRGAEAALDWRPAARWRQQLHYALLEGAGAGAPRHQLALRSVLDVQEWLRLHALLRHRSARLSADPLTAATPLPADTALDLALSWRVNARTEISLAGTNLLRPAAVEFMPDLGLSGATPIGRRWSLRLQTQL